MKMQAHDTDPLKTVRPPLSTQPLNKKDHTVTEARRPRPLKVHYQSELSQSPTKAVAVDKARP